MMRSKASIGKDEISPVSFLRPVAGQNQAVEAIQCLEKQVDAFDRAYGIGAERRFVVSAEPDYAGSGPNGATSGSLAALVEFLKDSQ